MDKKDLKEKLDFCKLQLKNLKKECKQLKLQLECKHSFITEIDTSVPSYILVRDGLTSWDYEKCEKCNYYKSKPYAKL